MNEEQKQDIIPLQDEHGNRIGDAIKNGNNAAWMCVCGYDKPLIWSGYIAHRKKDKKPFTVCEQCKNKYKGDEIRPTRIMKV